MDPSSSLEPHPTAVSTSAAPAAPPTPDHRTPGPRPVAFLQARYALVVAGFVGLIAYAWFQGRAPETGGPVESGMRFREVGSEAGVGGFRHVPPVVDEKVANIAAQITAVGAAVSVCDADGDGWYDLYVTSSGPGSRNALFRNRGDGSFEDVAPRAGLADLNPPGEGACMGSVWADYDADGDQDVFVYKWGRCQLLRNEGDLRFVDATEGSGLEGWINSNSATWFDFDGDGVLDLFVMGYFDESHDLWDLETTSIMHDSFEFSNNGGLNRLFRGRGDGTFEDVTEGSGLESRRWTYAAVAADFDRDGWQDLYVANDYGSEQLYLNQQGQGFAEVKGVGLEQESKSGMCVALGDVNNRGVPSVYVTNISERGFIFQGNNLREVHTDGPLLDMARGVSADCGWAWGAQFGDLDNDGWQDLVVANGFISASKDRDYWYNMTKVSASTADLVADAAAWPAFEDRSLSGYQRTRVLHNLGRARFREVGAEVGIDDVFDGRGVAFVDLWNRGCLDVVIACQNGPLLIYKNETPPAAHWVAFELEGSGANRAALGAEVLVEFGERKQVQVVTSFCGFASQNSGRLHFGLGEDPGPVRATVRWPYGGTVVLEDLELDRVHELVETQQ